MMKKVKIRVAVSLECSDQYQLEVVVGVIVLVPLQSTNQRQLGVVVAAVVVQ